MRSTYWLLATIAFLHTTSAYAQVESNFSGGGVRLGWSITNCAPAIAGSIRYNSGSGGSVDYCNGSTWQNIANGGGGTAASPTRGIQFNSSNSFAAASTFLYTTTGRLGLGTTTPSYTISLTGTGAAQSIGMENESTGTTDGQNLRFLAGGASGGNNRAGGEVVLNTGRATGHGTANIQLFTVMPGQGTGATVRSPALSMTVSSNALSIPAGTTAQRPGSTDMQAVANGMMRYNSTTNKFEGYQSGTWRDLISSDAGGATRTIQFNSAGSFGGDTNLVYSSVSRLGIGTSSPVARVDVEGAIQLGSSGENCSASTDHGNIRYNGESIQICNDYTLGWENIALGAPIVNTESCDATRNITTAGTYNYKIPNNFSTLTIRMWGGGGGGGAASYTNEGFIANGGTGGASSITSLNLMAAGGQGGGGAFDWPSSTPGTGGAGGTATGGDTNTNGNAGANAVNSTNSGAGGNAPGPGGGTGGASRPAVAFTNYAGLPGNAPGGGAGGAIYYNAAFAEGGGGGSGAYLEKTYSNTNIAPGTVISNIIVGAAGTAGNGNGYHNGGLGGTGRISIICVSGPPPGELVALDDLNNVTITTPTGGQALTYNGTNWVNGAGAGGTPAGLNTQIQFNNGGSAFGASSNLTWNGSKLSVTGDIEYTGVSTDISDQRLKNEITPLSPALVNIMAITPVSFTMKTDTTNAIEYGFIAQDIEKIYPALVKTANDIDQTKSVNYTGMIAPMIKTLQEQQKTMQQQRVRLEDQKKRLDALENSSSR